MKSLALCAGLLFVLSANAEVTARAKLVGQRVVSSFPGNPILICRYRGPEAVYEVIASKPTCDRYFELSETLRHTIP